MRNIATYHMATDLNTTSVANIKIRKGDTRRVLCSITRGGENVELFDGCYALFKIRKGQTRLYYDCCIINHNVISCDMVIPLGFESGIYSAELCIYGPDNCEIGLITILLSVYPTNISEMPRSLKETYSIISDYTEQILQSIVNTEAMRDSFKGEPGDKGPMGYIDTSPSVHGQLKLLAIDENGLIKVKGLRIYEGEVI